MHDGACLLATLRGNSAQGPCISEAAFASRIREVGRGVFHLLFLLAYACTVPTTFSTRAMHELTELPTKQGAMRCQTAVKVCSVDAVFLRNPSEG
jgi:hypothetical protein